LDTEVNESGAYESPVFSEEGFTAGEGEVFAFEFSQVFAEFDSFRGGEFGRSFLAGSGSAVSAVKVALECEFPDCESRSETEFFE